MAQALSTGGIQLRGIIRSGVPDLLTSGLALPSIDIGCASAQLQTN